MEQMVLTSDLSFSAQSIYSNLNKIINKVYKLLPLREQGQDWEKPLQTIIVELKGMKQLIFNEDELFLSILCKMEGLFSLTKKQDMSLYRRTIFECLGLLNNLNKNVCT